jgi:hypothetical protein
MPVWRGALLMAIAVAVPSAACGGALALGDGLAGGDLTRYETAHRLIRRMPAFMAELLLAMDRFPRLRVRALRAFSPEDSLFSRPLALHVRTPTSPTPAARYLDGLGWRLLTA